jgi:hypothetical protein
MLSDQTVRRWLAKNFGNRTSGKNSQSSGSGHRTMVSKQFDNESGEKGSLGYRIKPLGEN